jgi:hypothetical protein
MKQMMAVIFAWAMVGVPSFSLAADAPAPDHGAQPVHSANAPHGEAHAAPAHLTYAHPTVPRAHSLWPGTMLIWVGLMFVCAMIIGPIVRSEIPPEQAPHTHSHDEPPGASGHHGHSGTVQPGPEHDHRHH